MTLVIAGIGIDEPFQKELRGFEVEPVTASEYPKFADVVGLDSVVDDCRQILDCLMNPAEYSKAGMSAPRGILLEGPPGTGKTFLARAMANECRATFYYKSGSELEDMWVGHAAKKVQKLFKTAKQNAPAIIFIDEFDSIAGARNEINHTPESRSRADCSHQPAARRNGRLRQFRPRAGGRRVQFGARARPGHFASGPL